MTTARFSPALKARSLVWLILGVATCTNYRVAPNNDGGTGGSVSSAGGSGSGGSAAGGSGSGGNGTGGSIGAGGNGTGGNGTGGVAGANGTVGLGGSGMGGSGLGGATGGSPGAGGAGATDGGGTDRSGTRALGESCAGDGDCASAHCAGTVCCDQSCTGPCAQCSSAGHCQMPADDPACGTIACPADTPCRDLATSITVNRCKAVGQCKEMADCAYLNAPVKTYCGLYQGMTGLAQVCDGSGTCARPTVTCGLDGECPTADHVCCASGAAGSTCRVGSTCSPTDVGATCDEATDCPPNSVCCAWSNAGGKGISCLTSCSPAQFGTAALVCNPNTPG
jgi:hypothetical protein